MSKVIIWRNRGIQSGQYSRFELNHDVFDEASLDVFFIKPLVEHVQLVAAIGAGQSRGLFNHETGSPGAVDCVLTNNVSICDARGRTVVPSPFNTRKIAEVDDQRTPTASFLVEFQAAAMLAGPNWTADSTK